MCSTKSAWFILLWGVCLAKYPKELHMKWHLEFYMNDILVNLTKLICKDATLKLWQADRVQQRYINSASYELGVISAGIKDHFKHMLEVYKEYANVTHIRKRKYGPDDYLDAYHIIKGSFNELRMEADMFYEVLKRHEEKKRQETSKVSKLDAFLQKNKAKKAKAARTEMEEEYKKSLRYSKFLEKWDQTIPSIEGEDIDNFDLKDLD